MRVRVAIGLLLVTGRAGAEPVLEAVVVDERGAAFRLSEEVPAEVGGAGQKVASGFLRVGAEFRGWTLTKYEREAEALHVTDAAGATRVLRLKEARVGAAAESPAADPELRTLRGLPLARALAAKGDARMALKVKALDEAQKAVEIAKTNHEAIVKRLAEVHARRAAASTPAGSGSDAKDSAATDYLTQMEARMKDSHARLANAILRLQAKLAGDADFAVHGTPPPPLPPLLPGEKEEGVKE